MHLVTLSPSGRGQGEGSQQAEGSQRFLLPPLHNIQNALQHTVCFEQNLPIGDSDHRISGLFQIRRTRGVFLRRVLAAIDFDDEFQRPAQEIRYVWADRTLPNELASTKLSIAKVPPQHSFRIGQISS